MFNRKLWEVEAYPFKAVLRKKDVVFTSSGIHGEQKITISNNHELHHFLMNCLYVATDEEMNKTLTSVTCGVFINTLTNNIIKALGESHDTVEEALAKAAKEMPTRTQEQIDADDKESLKIIDEEKAFYEAVDTLQDAKKKPQDPTSRLNRLCHAEYGESPMFSKAESKSTDGVNAVFVNLTLPNGFSTVGVGQNKRGAKRHASEVALTHLEKELNE